MTNTDSNPQHRADSVRPTTENYGQFLFLEQVSRAQEQRPVLARIALAAAGFGSDYPVAMHDVTECLNSRNLLAVAMFLALVANARIQWSPVVLKELIAWAEEIGPQAVVIKA